MKKLAIYMACALLAPFALAQDDGPTIEGSVELNVEAAEDINAAVGNDARASQSVGAIESGSIDGNIEMGISAEQDINAAVGNDSCADQQIGTIGKKTSC